MPNTDYSKYTSREENNETVIGAGNCRILMSKQIIRSKLCSVQLQMTFSKSQWTLDSLMVLELQE